jgi:hypothetical protein
MDGCSCVSTRLGTVDLRHISLPPQCDADKGLIYRPQTTHSGGAMPTRRRRLGSITGLPYRNVRCYNIASNCRIYSRQAFESRIAIHSSRSRFAGAYPPGRGSPCSVASAGVFWIEDGRRRLFGVGHHTLFRTVCVITRILCCASQLLEM